MRRQTIPGEVTLADEITEIIRGRIIAGEYSMGERLVENQIAKELKVSRTPVRDAMKKLLSEELVEYVPNKGCFAKGFDSQDMKDVYAVRAAVEQLAVVWAIRNRTDKEMEKLRRQLEIMSLYTAQKSQEKLLQANEDFHNMIFHMTRSRFIVRALRTYQDYVHLARKATLSKEENIPEVYREHEEIFKAIEAGDEELAKAKIGEHLNGSAKRAAERWKAGIKISNSKLIP